jgi:hypothetical protein
MPSLLKNRRSTLVYASGDDWRLTQCFPDFYEAGNGQQHKHRDPRAWHFREPRTTLSAAAAKSGDRSGPKRRNVRQQEHGCNEAND